MENVKLLFVDSDESELQAFANTKNKLFIEIQMPDCYSSFITLDKATAIKLTKELKKQISYLED